MSAGLPVTAADVHLQAGEIARDVNTVLLRVRQFEGWLDTQTDQALESIGLTPEDIAVIRSSFDDLGLLDLIAAGGTTLPAAKDFFAFAQRLYGFGYRQIL